MHLWTGFITDKLKETREFYVDRLGFSVMFEADWVLLLRPPGANSRLGFLKPGLESQAPMFRKPYAGGGWIALDVDDVDAEFERIKKTGLKIAVPVRDEPWGDRHFVVVDPNGIGVDFVKFTDPEA
jgi:catechol 2,3-dioxygenase-like lactoylglutathione lyase family enzyme